MPEAVIVATARTPIGRANKGSPDRRAVPTTWPASSSRPCSRKVPALDPQTVEDVIVGCGQPGGESGYNVARVVAMLGRAARRPRRDRQPLLLVVAADHPHGGARDQGRRGRRVRRRRCRDRQPLRARARPTPGPTTRCSPTPRRTHGRARPGRRQLDAADGLPDIYIAMGQTAENVVDSPRTSPREEMDEFAALSQQRAVASAGERLLRPGDHPVTAAATARSCRRTTAPAPAPRSRSSPR